MKNKNNINHVKTSKTNSNENNNNNNIHNNIYIYIYICTILNTRTIIRMIAKTTKKQKTIDTTTA